MRWILSFLVLSLGAFGFAQPGGGGGSGGSSDVTIGYVRLRAVLSGLNDGQKVSGSSAVFSGQAQTLGLPWDEEAGPEEFVNARLDEFKIEISGEVVHQWPGSAIGGYAVVAFASTHFSHGAAIPLKVSAKWSLLKQKNRGTQNYEPGPSLSRQITVYAYNVGLALHTDEIFSGSVYSVPPTPTTSDWDTVSKLASATGVSALSSMKHQIGAGASMLKPELLQRLVPMTVFFGFTHGEPTNFRATRDAALSFAASNNEVLSAVSSRSLSIPDPNLVVMHSCDTLTTPGLASTAFKLTIGTTVIPNKAYAGFATPIHSMTLATSSNPSVTLNNHAGMIYNLLAVGFTIGYAVGEANREFTPRSSFANSKQNMLLNGDMHARLINVYTGQSASTNWYKVTAPQ